MAEAPTGKSTQLEAYYAEVLPPQKEAELFRTLPSHIRPAVFQRNLMSALMANPELMQHPPAYIYREIVKCAGLGLYLDPLLGLAYIVVAWNYKTQRKEPQLRIGYKGMIKLVRQAGNVATVSCHEVHAYDEVEVDFGNPKVFHHRPRLFSDRGPIVGYVATISFKDGAFDLEPMSVQQCLAVRDRSDAWRAFKEGKIRSTPWSTDEMEMCKKTNLRRLLKRQEQSPEVASADQIEDDAELGINESRPPPSFRIERRANQAPMIAPTTQDQTAPITKAPETAPPLDRKTGEVLPPHDIGFRDTEDGTAETWQQWGARLVAAINAASSEAEIDQWVEHNQKHFATFKQDALLMFGKLEAAIAKRREAVKGKGAQKGDHA